MVKSGRIFGKTCKNCSKTVESVPVRTGWAGAGGDGGGATVE